VTHLKFEVKPPDRHKLYHGVKLVSRSDAMFGMQMSKFFAQLGRLCEQYISHPIRGQKVVIEISIK
jgi:hypothetical protein